MPNGGTDKPKQELLTGAETVGLRVSLIPTEEAPVSDPRRGFRLWLIVCGILLLLMIVGAVLLWYRVKDAETEVIRLEAQTASIKGEIQSMSSEYSSARYIQNQLKVLATLVKSHKYATNIFSFLEKRTLLKVAYISAALSDDGRLTLTAEAADYQALAEQLSEYRRDPLVKTANVSGIGATLDEKGKISKINFTVSLLFDPVIFSRAK